MQPATLLLRQVHPTWLKDGQVLSLAFRPFPKDAGLLSVYDGDLITAEASHTHLRETWAFNQPGFGQCPFKSVNRAICLPVRMRQSIIPNMR